MSSNFLVFRSQRSFSNTPSGSSLSRPRYACLSPAIRGTLATRTATEAIPTIPGVTCHKEGIGFCEELPADDPDILSREKYPYEPNMWPPTTVPGAAEFKRFILSYYQSMSKLSLEIVRLLALGLGKEEGFFDELFLHKPMSTLRLMHYPLRPGPAPESAKKDGHILTCLEHTDTNFATFLCTFTNRGLQILESDGSWSDVEVRPDCLVMNAGDALVKTTGLFKATRHRVIDCGEERFSVPFFVEPSYDGDIGRFSREMRRERGSSCDYGDDDDEPSLYGPWLAARMSAKNYTDYPPENKK